MYILNKGGLDMKQKQFQKIIMMIVLLFICNPITTYALSPDSSIIYKGIDVSHWQGDINYTKVKDAGIEIVYIKATEGQNTVDPYFSSNYEKAKAAGLKIGLYHFVRAISTDAAILEAKHFVNTISRNCSRL